MKSRRSMRFSMDELGIGQHILGMRVVRNPIKNILWLFRTNYMKRVLKSCNIEALKPTVDKSCTPINKMNEPSPKIELGRTPYT